MSALSAHNTLSIAPVMFSKKSQKHRKATPRFQLWRMKLVVRTNNKLAAASAQATGYSG